MKRVILVLAAVAAVCVAWLCLWPVPVQPLAWQAPAFAGYTGAHAPNERLARLNLIALGDEEGPEHVALGPDGRLYAAVASGRILRMSPDGSGRQVFASTGGRVLGFDFDAAGNLVAADAVRGLLSVSPSGQVSVLADRHAGVPLLFTDAVVVAPSGRIYFSDASMRFGPAAWGGTFEASVLDIFELGTTGRILEYDPVTRATRVVARGFSFSNGVALTGDGQALLVSETAKFRVWKIATSARELDVGQPSAQAKVLLDNLPGYPDNLMRGRDGRIWLGLAKPRNPKLDGLAAKPFLRTVILRLPRALWPIPMAYGHAIAFTEDGKVVADLQDPSGAYPETTGVTETADRLYIQSLHAKALGWMPRPAP